jgi:preprotein translocase subunit SecA
MALFGSVISGIKSVPRKLFGTRNDRLLKRMRRTVEVARGLEAQIRPLCSEGNDYDAAFARRAAALVKPDAADEKAVQADEQQLQQIRVELSIPLKERAQALASRLQSGPTSYEEMGEAFAILREASRRAQAHRHFDCQIIGGTVLADGKVAEMRTGEGKTIVCHLAAFLKALEGKKVHVVTVNDYLVRRDAEFAEPVFELLGYRVGYIQSLVDPGGREGVRKAMYDCDITYGTASEFGFDYLRDNMKVRWEEQVQGRLDFCIIDEVDSILIDEARTPLIISGPAQDDVSRYPRANRVAEELVRRQLSWDRKVMQTVAKFDGDTHGIPKLDDAMNILGAKERKGSRKKPQPVAVGDGVAEAATEEDGESDAPTLGPDFLTDDHVEAIQIFENNILKVAPSEQYRRYFIVQLERKQVGITHEGVTIAQELLDIGSLYSGSNMEWPHLIENALRAHKTYARDRDYVVKDGAIIIVDQFTGRLMHGRQWSDGLHQAVEAKEAVTVKEETQTLATITIQNFFKLYKEKAGMTGTAMTEAGEFLKIYNLDCIEIPTNRPVNRMDHNDKMYRDTDQKYGAIVDEIHEVHRRGRAADPFMLADLFKALRPILVKQNASVERLDEAMRRFNEATTFDPKVIAFMAEVYDELMGDMAVGRPILVGTTSVENSEKLSRLLERRYGIEHEVLNAKNHAREAEIVAKAGQQSLSSRSNSKQVVGNVTIATNMAGRGTDIKLGLNVVYPKCKTPADSALPAGVQPSTMYPAGVTKCCISCEEYDPSTNCAHCYKPKLDPRFPELGRKVCKLNVPCGLHIIATERHEARRIDNQLRGRAGRQGDPGSSRFFLSLQDELLKLFMSDFMLKMMEKLGFTDGSSLEDKRLTKGIEKAQRKVEERNFSTRKRLLEWDEPMDYQRKEFYKSRQRILEENGLDGIILETIQNAIESTVDEHLGKGYRQQCVAEWCRSTLELPIEDSVIDTSDFDSAERSIRRRARDEVADQIRTSIGEYIDPEEPAKNWDLGGLVNWAQRLFKFSLSQNHLRKMQPDEIEQALFDAAEEHFGGISVEGIAPFLEDVFPYRSLAEWATTKFSLKVTTQELAGKGRDEVVALLAEKVRESYADREITYPAEYCIERAMQAEQQQPGLGTQMILQWANFKYRLAWTGADIQGKSPEELQRTLAGLNKEYLHNGRLEREIAEATAGLDREAKIEWIRQRCGPAFHAPQFARYENDVDAGILAQARRLIRWELSRLEQYVLLRIYDQAWKDHLLEMDHLKSAIQQRPLGGDQTHPQSQFAIEGRDLFAQMWSRVANRVTDVVFKVRIAPTEIAAGAAAGPLPTEAGSQRPESKAVSYQHVDATGAGFGAAARDTEAAMRAQNVEQKIETIRREEPKVGRNDPCPCGSGKKFKQCHGRGG